MLAERNGNASAGAAAGSGNNGNRILAPLIQDENLREE